MKTINDKNYYVCVGYVDKEKLEDGNYSTKDIKSIYIKPENEDVALYTDDSDKDNVVYLPLIAVNNIQKKDDKYIVTVMINPLKDKVEFGDEDMVKINTILLFIEYKKDKVQYLKHVSSYHVTFPEIIHNIPSKQKVVTVNLELEEKYIF